MCMKCDLILSFAHADFRVNMVQNDDNQTLTMAQDDDMSPDDSRTPPSPSTHPPRFTIEEEQTRQYRRFNARGTQLTVRLLPPPEGEDPTPLSHFLDSVTEFFEHALRDLEDSDMVGITISNEAEVKDSYRDQLQKKGSQSGRCGLVGVREGGPVEC